MNTEMNLEEKVEESMTPGARLRQAREQMGLSQRVIAERLCLMMSTVREIEEDRLSPNLAPTFARGYIRSYAKLVNIPEEQVLPKIIEEEKPARTVKTAAMQSYSLTKKRKKRDGWLMIFTCLVLFVLVGLTGAWWWQNHQAKQKEIKEMAADSSAKLKQQEQQEQPVELGLSSTPAVAPPSSVATTTAQNTQPPATEGASLPIAQGGASTVVAATSATTPAPSTAASVPVKNVESLAPPALAVAPAVPVPAVGQASQTPATLPLPNNGQVPTTAPAITENSTVADKGLVLSFSADCWLEVRDATGKTLVSTLQKQGSTLNLSGTAPYHLKIGVPSAVKIHYQGAPVDLGAVANSNRVARITVPRR